MIPLTIKEAVQVAASGQFTEQYTRSFVLVLIQLQLAFFSYNLRIFSARHAMTPVPFITMLQNTSEENVPFALLSCKILANWFGTADSSTAYQIFTDNNGLRIVLDRVHGEVQQILSWFNGKGETNPDFLAKQRRKYIPNRSFREQVDSPSTYHHSLCRRFLSLLMVTFNIPSRGVSNGNVGELVQGNLHETLLAVLKDWRPFSANIYSRCIQMVSRFIEVDPGSYSMVYDTGVISTALNSIVDPNCPYDVALSDICTLLPSVCLNEKGITEMKEKEVLRKVMMVLKREDHVYSVKTRVYSSLGSTINELMRHHAALRSDTLTSCLDVMKEVLEVIKGCTKSNTASTMILNTELQPSLTAHSIHTFNQFLWIF